MPGRSFNSNNPFNDPSSFSRGSYQQLRAGAGTPEPPLLAAAAPVGYSQRLSDSSLNSEMNPSSHSHSHAPYGRMQSVSSQASRDTLPNSSSTSRLLPAGPSSSNSSHSAARRYGPSAATGAGAGAAAGAAAAAAAAAAAVQSGPSPLPSRVAEAYSGLSAERMAQLEKIDEEIHSTDTTERGLASTFYLWSWRGWTNALTLAVLAVALVGLFALYPLLSFYFENGAVNGSGTSGYNLGGINGTGQYPSIAGFPQLIDPDTPDDVKTRVGHDGNTWKLVFSDEFNKDGRTFYDGDDPFFQAVDIHYWATSDYEWYDPSMVTTKNGYLQLTIDQEPINFLNLKSGMVQSWNKLCFSKNAYIEVSVSLPGSHEHGGMWPGVWTMGNLGRPGYGATTEGLWPYSYDSCDVGTLPNQTEPDGSGPQAALTSGKGDWVDGTQPPAQLSKLPGQRLSACTCPGEDHPGPNVGVGRAAPEIDIIEAQIDYSNRPSGVSGQVSQSYQLAPFDEHYWTDMISAGTHQIYQPDLTGFNAYTGGQYQQSASAVTFLNNNQQYWDTAGENAVFSSYGMEWSSNKDDRESAYIAWWSEGQPSWTVTGKALRANASVGVGQRVITEEPMALVFNLGASDGFEAVDWNNMNYPNYMRIDYVRVYQLPSGLVGCDPSDYPTAQYIERHAEAYNNPNYTVWQTPTDPNSNQNPYGQPWPKNRLKDTC